MNVIITFEVDLIGRSLCNGVERNFRFHKKEEMNNL